MVQSDAKISAVIADVGSRETLRLCLQQLKVSLLGYNSEVIIVTGSSKDRRAFCLAIEPHCRLEAIPAGTSLGCMYNIGGGKASGSYILFLSSEVIFLRDTFACLFSAVNGWKSAGAVGPVSNFAYGEQHAVVGEGVYSSIDEMEEYLARNRHEVSADLGMILDAFCLLVKREAWEKTGSFDESLPAGLSCTLGMDYSIRLFFAGFRLLCVTTFVHCGSPKYENDDFRADTGYLGNKWGFSPTYSLNIRLSLLRYADIMKENLAVLDVGCAAGGTLMFVKEMNPSSKVYGIEMNEGSAKMAGLFADVQAVDVEQAELQGWRGKFDVILAGDILEHLRNPWQAVRNLADCLDDGGRLIASIPNVMFVDVIANMLEGRWQYMEQGILDKTHLRFFTRESVFTMMTEAGLHVTVLEPAYRVDNAEIREIVKSLEKIPYLQVKADELYVYQWLVVAEKRGSC